MACSHCLMFIQTPTEARGVSLANSRLYRAFNVYSLFPVQGSRASTVNSEGFLKLWARAWFPEIVFRKVCVCMFVCIFVCLSAPT